MYKELTYRDIKFAEDEQQVYLNSIPFGMVFKRTPDASKVYIKGNYIREANIKRFSCTDWDDMNREVYLKGTTIVYVGFEM